MIKPTIGRRVWYWPRKGDPKSPFTVLDPGQALDAGVIFVHDDRTVNLSVTDHQGSTHAVHGAFLAQEGDAVPGDGGFAEWMPYQTGQAKKEAAQTPAFNPDAGKASPPPAPLNTGAAKKP